MFRMCRLHSVASRLLEVPSAYISPLTGRSPFATLRLCGCPLPSISDYTPAHRTPHCNVHHLAGGDQLDLDRPLRPIFHSRPTVKHASEQSEKRTRWAWETLSRRDGMVSLSRSYGTGDSHTEVA
jgi:hypothetical protein